MTNKKEETKKIKEELAKLPNFKSRCYVCRCKSHPKGMTFHHLRYEKFEKTYKDFKNPFDYYDYLRIKVAEDPKRFLYVCSPHHQSIERLKRFCGDKFARLVRAVRMSK